jgi:hypothetical protein
MNSFKFLYNSLKDVYENTEAKFTGIFLNAKLLVDFSNISGNKKKRIEERLSHLIEKSAEIKEVLPDFGKKYLYAEGEDFAIFIFFIDEDLSVGSIFEKKPKFAAILLEHEIFSNKLKKNPEVLKDIKSVDIKNFDIEKYLQEEKKEVPESIIEEVCEVISEEETEETEEVVPTLEDLIKESIEEYEKKSAFYDNDKKIEEKIKEERHQKEEFVDPIILEHIEKEFVKEIGPIAKLILNRKLTELNINPEKLKTEDVILLIQELAKEIRLEEKKEKFLNETNDLL